MRSSRRWLHGESYDPHTANSILNTDNAVGSLLALLRHGTLATKEHVLIILRSVRMLHEDACHRWFCLPLLPERPAARRTPSVSMESVNVPQQRHSQGRNTPSSSCRIRGGDAGDATVRCLEER